MLNSIKINKFKDIEIRNVINSSEDFTPDVYWIVTYNKFLGYPPNLLHECSNVDCSNKRAQGAHVSTNQCLNLQITNEKSITFNSNDDTNQGNMYIIPLCSTCNHSKNRSIMKVTCKALRRRNLFN